MDINTIDKKLEDLALKYGWRLKTSIDHGKDIYHCLFRYDAYRPVAISRIITISRANQRTFDEIENSLRRYTDEITNPMKLALNSVYGTNCNTWSFGRNTNYNRTSTFVNDLKHITKELGYGGDFDGDTVSKVTITGGLTMYTNFEIKNVIFNDPATIVFWKDGTKTVVQAHNDEFDPEKGLAMAIAKKALGNNGNYYNKIKKWLPDEKAVNNADGEN